MLLVQDVIIFLIFEKVKRKISGLSQKELAELSGVPLRQIQLFEQRQRDINHTRAIDVVKMSRVLGCKVEDLLQI